MNSVTDIFQRIYLDFNNTVLSPPCSPCVLTQAPPMFSMPLGARYIVIITLSIHYIGFFYSEHNTVPNPLLMTKYSSDSCNELLILSKLWRSYGMTGKFYIYKRFHWNNKLFFHERLAAFSCRFIIIILKLF